MVTDGIQDPNELGEGAAPATPEDNGDGVEFQLIDDSGQPQGQQEDLAEKLRQLEEQNATLNAQLQENAQTAVPQTQTANDPSLAMIAEALKELKAGNAPAKPEQNAFDFNSHIEAVNKDFYNNPGQATIQAVTPVVTELNKSFQDKYAALEMKTGKLTMMMNPDNSALYTKYKDEVEEAVKGMAPSESAWNDALNVVKMRHVDDIAAERSSKIVEEKLAELEAKLEAATKGQVTQQRPQGFTQAGFVSNPAPPKKKVLQYSSNMERLGKEWAYTRGLDWNDTGDREVIIETLQSKGVR